MVKLKTFYLGSIIMLMGCGSAPQTLPTKTTTTTTTTATASVLVDTPYAYSGNSSCWTDKIKTNGTSFGATGNSGYFCHVIGSGGSLDNDYFWVGFYRDGTLSYTRRGSIDTVYTAFANPVNCDLGFDNPSHSLRFVNFEGGILDSSSHMINITNQQYYTTPPTITDQYALACVFKSQYGIQ